jgi:hypothetical protein
LNSTTGTGSTRRLVVDACVASQTGTGEWPLCTPWQKLCRSFLESVYSLRHTIVMCPRLSAEWKSHETSYACSWRTRMWNRRRTVFESRDIADSTLRRAMASVSNGTNELKEMMKDEHLLTTAMKHDRVVFSTDDAARILFRRVAAADTRLVGLTWGNPARQYANCANWLACCTRDAAILVA